MVVWKMTLVSKDAIFHFHDYGRKGKFAGRWQGGEKGCWIFENDSQKVQAMAA